MDGSERNSSERILLDLRNEDDEYEEMMGMKAFSLCPRGKVDTSLVKEDIGVSEDRGGGLGSTLPIYDDDMIRFTTSHRGNQ
jgi:hypothetical protein